MRLAIKLTFWLLLLMFISCMEPEKKENQERNKLIQRLYPDTIISGQLATNHLCNAKEIQGAAIGIAGVKTDLYKSYEWLIRKGSDSVLSELVNHPNPYTRTYAFMALCKRKHLSVKGLIEKNINDTTILQTISGCLGGSCQLNGMWFHSVQKVLTDTELGVLYKKIYKKQPIPLCIWTE